MTWETAIKLAALWFLATLLLRELRMWQRQVMLLKLEREFGQQFTEEEVFGDWLDHLWP